MTTFKFLSDAAVPHYDMDAYGGLIPLGTKSFTIDEIIEATYMGKDKLVLEDGTVIKYEDHMLSSNCEAAC